MFWFCVIDVGGMKWKIICLRRYWLKWMVLYSIYDNKYVEICNLGNV